MRAWTVLLAACVGGALLAAWWRTTADPPPPPPPAGPAPAVATGDETAAIASAGEPADASDADPEDAVPADPDADGDLRVDATASPRGPRVQVLRGDPPQPVVGATVWFVTEPTATARLAGGTRPLSRAEWPEAFGQRTTSGDDGVAVLPRSATAWLVAAAADGEFGFAAVPPRDRLQPLALLRDEQVVLVARHADGAPAAAAPLAIVQHRGDQQTRPLWQGEAGADGRVVVRHFQLVRDDQPTPPAEQFAALPLVPGATAVVFPGRPAAGEPVELLLPALGGVVVRVVDHRGTPVLSPATVGIAGDQKVAFAGGDPFAVPRGLLAQRRPKPVGDDPVLLPWHQVGTPVQAYARFDTDRQPAVADPVPGPAAPGRRVEVAVPLSARQAVLAGRLVFADGSPAGALRVDGALWRADRDVLTHAVHTVADGRFDLVLAQRTDATEFWLELRRDERIVAVAANDGDAATAATQPMALGARVRVPAIAGGRRIELGDIVLGELPLLVTGTVVDDAGAPVAGADVQLQQQLPVPEGSGQRPEDAWRLLPLRRTRTAADGSFRIPGLLPPGVLRVHADTDRHFAASVPVQLQGQVVRLAIDRNGVLRGRALLPEGLPDGVLSLQLRPFDQARQRDETRTTPLSRRRGGRFALEPLRPGRHDAVVLLRNVPEPVLVVPDVFVEPGETRDRRFAPLDLTGAVHRYRLRAVDATGAAFAPEGPILARLQGPDGTLVDATFRWRQGRAELLAPRPFAELLFFGRGHRTVRQMLPPGEHDVVLPRLDPALVELPGLRALCGPGRRVRISAILQGDTGLPAWLGGTDQGSGERFGFARWDLGRSSGGWLGDTDTVAIPVMQGGKYQLLLRPHATDSERSPQGELSLGVFDLQVDPPRGWPVRVPIDAAAVLQTLQQLDARARQPVDASGPRPR